MMEYQKRFLRLIENVEKLLKVSIFIFLLLLIISQILVKIPFLQPILVDVVKLEGIASK
jgi:hypothetical protein